MHELAGNLSQHELEVRGADAPRKARGPVPGKRTLVDKLYGAPVQLRSLAPGERDDEQVRAAAARGIATTSAPLPYSSSIQRSFGRHDISAIRAHIGGAAAASARAIGALGYAAGDHVVLGDAADLFTVAHEAAHVVQQRAGVSVAGGVGAVGDAYERHADAVAERVVRGESAEALLDQTAGSGAAPSSPAVQCLRAGTHADALGPAAPFLQGTPEQQADLLKQLVVEISRRHPDDRVRPALIERVYWAFDDGDREQLTARLLELDTQLAEERRQRACQQGANFNDYDTYVRVDRSTVVGTLPPIRASAARHMGYQCEKDFADSGWMSLFQLDDNARTVYHALPSGDYMHFVFIPKTNVATALTQSTVESEDRAGLYSTPLPQKCGSLDQHGRFFPSATDYVYIDEHLLAGPLPPGAFSLTVPSDAGNATLLRAGWAAAAAMFEQALRGHRPPQPMAPQAAQQIVQQAEQYEEEYDEQYEEEQEDREPLVPERVRGSDEDLDSDDNLDGPDYVYSEDEEDEEEEVDDDWDAMSGVGSERGDDDDDGMDD